MLLRYKPNLLIYLEESEIKWLCNKASEIFMNQPVFLELEAPIKICGNLLTLKFDY